MSLDSRVRGDEVLIRVDVASLGISLVCEKLIDMPRAVAYIRYHIDFRACRGRGFVARLESAMETSGQDRLMLSEAMDLVVRDFSASGIEPVD